MYVYKITNLINKKIYIGLSTLEDKYSVENYYGSGILIKRALEKYGKKNFKKEIVFESNDIEEIKKEEIRLITEIHNKGIENYNIAEGGQTGNWTEHKTEEELEEIKNKMINSLKKYYKENDVWNKGKTLDYGHKISKALKGRTVPREVVEKQRKANTGKRRTDKQKKNISKGIKEAYKHGFSDEHKKAISKALTGRKLPEEQRLRMKKPKSKVECPHCKKIGGKPIMKRFHFENCKFKE